MLRDTPTGAVLSRISLVAATFVLTQAPRSVLAQTAADKALAIAREKAAAPIPSPSKEVSAKDKKTTKASTDPKTPVNAANDLTAREKKWIDPKLTVRYSNTPKKDAAKMAAFLAEARKDILENELLPSMREEYRKAITPPKAEAIEIALVRAVQLDKDEQQALSKLKFNDTQRKEIDLQNRKPIERGAYDRKFTTNLKNNYATVLDFYKDAMEPYTDTKGETKIDFTRNPTWIVDKFRRRVPPPEPPKPTGPAVGPGLTFPHHDVIVYYLERYEKDDYATYLRRRKEIMDSNLWPAEKEKKLAELDKEYADKYYQKMIDRARTDASLFQYLSNAQKRDLCAPFIKTATEGTPEEKASRDFKSNEIKAYNQAMEIAKKAGTSESAAVAQGWHGAPMDEGLQTDVKALCIAFLFSAPKEKSATASVPNLAGPGTDLKDQGKDKPWYTQLTKEDASNIKAGAAGMLVGALVGSFFTFPVGPIVGAAIGGATFFGANWLLNKQP